MADLGYRAIARPGAGLRCVTALLAAVALLACQEASDSRSRAAGEAGAAGRRAAGPASPPTTLGEFVEWTSEIRLEENDAVINAWPYVRIDPRGGFLVADVQEAQLRRYAGDGALVAAFSREGNGPGEFEAPVAALRLPDGSILGLGRSGRYARFDSAAGGLLESGRWPFSSVSDADLLADSSLLIAGRHAPAGEKRLHLWDAASERVAASFFAPPQRRIASPVTAAVGQRRIAAVFGLSDTLYVFDRRGAEQGRIPLPSETLRPYSDPDTRRPSREWYASFSILEDAFWLPDGSILVQYGDRLDGTLHWRLLNMTLEGERVFELLDTPRLLAAADRGRRLYFVAPASLAPNRWRVGRPRTRSVPR